jgi:hypothetical protein
MLFCWRIYSFAYKSLARPTSRCIFFDGENILFDSSLVIQGVSRLYVITAGGDFLGLGEEKSSYKHVSDFGRLRSYDRFDVITSLVSMR